MNILREVAEEIASMFVADARLTLSTLGTVLLVAFLIKSAVIGPLAVGGILLAGCLVILVIAVYREARKRMR